MVSFMPSICLSIRKSCQRRDCSEFGKYSELGRTLIMYESISLVPVRPYLSACFDIFLNVCEFLFSFLAGVVLLK